MRDRPLYRRVWEGLSKNKAMIFMAGPRQVGKTTLAQALADTFKNRVYFNWDFVEDRRRLIEDPAFFDRINRVDSSPPLVVLDEIHKYRFWKNYLKGVYDRFHGRYLFLVLGSGRLNVFQKGGDSLAGRYFLFTLWPFTVAELAESRWPFERFQKAPLELPPRDPSPDLWRQLTRLSGFPEPFLSGDEEVYRRWSRTYRQQLVREDIRNLTEIKRIDDVETLVALLPSKVGSPLSMDSLARDLQVSFHSIRNWLDVLESTYVVFRIPPWSRKIARAITKERKLYLFDYAAITNEAARFENMIALELLRAVTVWSDLGKGTFTLHYLRNKEKEEVDFLVVRDLRPWLLVEAKWDDDTIAPALQKFQVLLRVPAVQLVQRPGIHKLLSNQDQSLLIASAPRWLAGLP